MTDLSVMIIVSIDVSQAPATNHEVQRVSRGMAERYQMRGTAVLVLDFSGRRWLQSLLRYLANHQQTISSIEDFESTSAADRDKWNFREFIEAFTRGLSSGLSKIAPKVTGVWHRPSRNMGRRRCGLMFVAHGNTYFAPTGQLLAFLTILVHSQIVPLGHYLSNVLLFQCFAGSELRGGRTAAPTQGQVHSFVNTLLELSSAGHGFRTSASLSIRMKAALLTLRRSRDPTHLYPEVTAWRRYITVTGAASLESENLLRSTASYLGGDVARENVRNEKVRFTPMLAQDGTGVSYRQVAFGDGEGEQSLSDSDSDGEEDIRDRPVSRATAPIEITQNENDLPPD